MLHNNTHLWLVDTKILISDWLIFQLWSLSHHPTPVWLRSGVSHSRLETTRRRRRPARWSETWSRSWTPGTPASHSPAWCTSCSCSLTSCWRCPAAWRVTETSSWSLNLSWTMCGDEWEDYHYTTTQPNKCSNRDELAKWKIFDLTVRTYLQRENSMKSDKYVLPELY